MGQGERDFTLRQLRTFICAAKSGSFSHAAEELGISQPAVSDQIALLESRLGHTLFLRRIGTTPTLTPQGMQLLEKAGSLIDTSASMHSETGRTQQQRVRISMGPRMRDFYFKPILPHLYRSIPGLSVELSPMMPRRDVQSALERRRLDLVVYTLGHLPDGWPNVRIVSDVMAVMTGPAGIRQRLERGDERIEDLQFILVSTGDAGESWLERQLQRLQIRLSRPIIYVEFPDVIEQMVVDGQGVTMLMYEQLAGSIAAGRLEIFGPQLPPMQRVIARSNSAPPAARVIEEHLIAAMKGPPLGMVSM